MNEWLCESKKRMNIWEKLMFIQKNFLLNTALYVITILLKIA